MKLILNGGLAALAGIAAPASVLAGLGQYKKKYVVSLKNSPHEAHILAMIYCPTKKSCLPQWLAKSMLLPRKFGPILTN